MFCNKCGSALDATSRCPSCGAVAIGATQSSGYAGPAAVYVESKLVRRLPVLAVLLIIYGVLEALRAAAAQFFAHLSRFWLTGPDWSHWIGPWVLGWIFVWSVAMAVLAFIAAWGLHERLSWGRIVSIAAAIFALFHPPFGTILGIYTLVLLLPADAAAQYDRVARI